MESLKKSSIADACNRYDHNKQSSYKGLGSWIQVIGAQDIFIGVIFNTKHTEFINIVDKYIA